MLATPLFMSFLIGCVEVEDQKTSLFLKIKIDPGDIPVEEYVVGDEIDYNISICNNISHRVNITGTVVAETCVS